MATEDGLSEKLDAARCDIKRLKLRIETLHAHFAARLQGLEAIPWPSARPNPESPERLALLCEELLHQQPITQRWMFAIERKLNVIGAALPNLLAGAGWANSAARQAAEAEFPP